jgi:hypothetical protein
MLTRKDILTLAALLLAPIALPAAAAGINAIGPDHCDLSRDWNFEGQTLIVLTCRGKLNMVRSSRIIERF